MTSFTPFDQLQIPKGVDMTTTSTDVGSEVPDDTGRLDGASRWRIFSVLAIIVLFTEVAPIQYTMIAAALQKIAPSFPEVGANITWAMIVYGLIGAAASPLIGKMSDVWGKKRMFVICGLLFIVGCLLSAVATNWTLFLVGRCLQSSAIATAVVAYGLIRDLMPRKYVTIGLGITSTGFGFSAALAPLLAGWLVDNYSWRAMFWFLFAFAAVMLPLVLLFVPESQLRVRESIDYVGAALISIGSALVLIYIDKGQDWGWAKPSALAWLIVGLLLLTLFVVVEFRVTTPIMNMTLLFHPRVSLVLLAAVLASCMIGVQGYAVAYMVQTPDQSVIQGGVVDATVAQVAKATGHELPPGMVNVSLDPGYSYGSGFTLLEFALKISLAFGLMAMVFGLVGGILARRFGVRLPLIVAAAIFTVGAVVQAAGPHTWQLFVVVSAVLGIAQGCYYAAAPNLITEAVPQEQQGISVGMLGIMQSLGVAVGVAVVTAFVNAHPVRAVVSVAGGPPQSSVVPGVFADRGYELGFWFAAIAVGAALIIALVMKHGRTPATGGARMDHQTSSGAPADEERID
ncbi:MFS transporter [Nocardia aobensis]|uniref:MFS transporter n=1 Tax=Nocardia aobensis TaxID=257277 RepID=A0ABW6PEL0_9NOCA|nr:MFS transporter [Nocardia elegans]